jgi:SAM-dependent methyltransferase
LNTTIEYLSPISGTGFIDQWYELADANHFWVQWRFLALKNLLQQSNLPIDRPLRVLDIASGNGVLREQLERETNWQVDCADLNAAGLARTRPGRGKTLYYNIEDRSAQQVGKYDLVFAFDVIEHLPHPEGFLRACADHLKPGGKLLVNVPALQSLYSNYDRAVGHIRRYNRTTLTTELKEAGCTTHHVTYWGGLLVPVLMVRKWVLSLLHDDQQVLQTGFKPPTGLINRAFRVLASFETRMLRQPPLGSSVMAVAEKCG